MSHRTLIGLNIRRLRIAKNWSQEKLAIQSDLSPDYLSKLERGAVNVSLDSLARIARTLRVKLAELVQE